MAWNNLLDQLTYYLANLYLLDITHTRKIQLFTSAGFKALDIRWNETPVNVWYQLLKHAADRNKVDKLLEAILKDEEGNSDDEFLKGALKNIQENKDIPLKKMTDAEWKGGPLKDETREKILGKKSTLLPIGFLERGTEKSKAIVRIEYDDTVGTGFVIENGWLLTNNHVIPTPEIASKASIQFGYQFPKDMKTFQKSVSELKPERVVSLDPGTAEQATFFTNEQEDWTLVKIREKDIEAYGYLQLSSAGVKENDFVNIIQHPLGGPKQIGIYNNLVMYVDDDLVQYMTDTAEGSSGSPVLNSDWDVVALHHSGGWLMDPKTKQAVRRNQGTNIQKIKEFIASKQLNSA